MATRQETALVISSQLSSLTDSSNDIIIIIDTGSIIRNWNRMAEKVFGYSPEEAVGKHISLIIPEDKLAEEDVIWRGIHQGQVIRLVETVRQTKDGLPIPFSIIISPLKNDAGEIVGMIWIGRDIRSQKRDEERNAVLAAIVNSSEDAIVSKDLNGYITSWNPAAETIFKYTEREVLGKHITIIIPERLRSEEDMIISQVKKGNRVEHFETKRVRKDGVEIDLSITVSPIKNESGEIIGASKIARDISEAVVIRKQLEIYTEQLKKLNRYKDDFISVASHELNTPLTSLRVYLDMLEMNLIKDVKSVNYTYLSKSIGLTHKLTKLVKDLLDVSRIEAGKMHLQMASFDILQLLLETTESIQVTSRKHKIEYHSPLAPIHIKGDKLRLEQVFINLLSNAIKYSPYSDLIIVNTKEEDNRVSVSIEDFGIGIPVSEEKEIFSRFYRAEGLAQTFPGLGIGLYVSNEIVQGHKGEITVFSKEGKGSVFTVRLPLQARD